MDYNYNQYEQEELKKEKKKSMWKGIFIGGGCALGICLFFIGCLLAILLKLSTSGTLGKFALGEEALTKMNDLINYADENYLYEVDKEVMEEAIYGAIFDSLGDPYSTYYTPEEYKEIMESTSGTYCGIGVVVQEDVETGYILVVEPYENGPAYEEGLRSGDYIIAVNGEDIKDTDINLIVKEIKGEKGTEVTITARRDGEDFDLCITRREIEIKTVDYEILEDGVGYIAISSFEGNCVEQFKDAYDDLIDEGMTSLVIDIRNNPGGLLTAVTEMLDLFIEEDELIVYTMDKNGNRNDYCAKNDVEIEIPCVVLVNGNSASASEIFAGALQDYELAHIMGTQSFGKGIVQTMIGLRDGSAFKVTIEDYYTPNGNNIHGIGITPDEVVELDVDAYNEDGTDTQLEAAIEHLTK